MLIVTLLPSQLSVMEAAAFQAADVISAMNCSQNQQSESLSEGKFEEYIGRGTWRAPGYGTS